MVPKMEEGIKNNNGEQVMKRTELMAGAKWGEELNYDSEKKKERWLKKSKDRKKMQ